MSPMPVGKQVFLLGIGAITTVMPRMTPAMTTVKKAAVGGKKSPAGAGTKTAAWEKALPTLLMPIPTLLKPLPVPPQGAGAIPAVFEAVSMSSLPLGRDGEGLTQGAGAHSCCVLDGLVGRPPFGEGWGGAYTRGGSPFLLCFRRLCETPSLWGGLGRGLHKGREPIPAVFKAVVWNALPLGGH